MAAIKCPACGIGDLERIDDFWCSCCGSTATDLGVVTRPRVEPSSMVTVVGHEMRAIGRTHLAMGGALLVAAAVLLAFGASVHAYLLVMSLIGGTLFFGGLTLERKWKDPPCTTCGGTRSLPASGPWAGRFVCLKCLGTGKR